MLAWVASNGERLEWLNSAATSSPSVSLCGEEFGLSLQKLLLFLPKFPEFTLSSSSSADLNFLYRGSEPGNGLPLLKVVRVPLVARLFFLEGQVRLTKCISSGLSRLKWTCSNSMFFEGSPFPFTGTFRKPYRLSCLTKLVKFLVLNISALSSRT